MTKATVVVIKVFQESLFPPVDDDDYEDGAKQARAEACSYKLMSRVQGRSVPWSYGFFKFKMSHGEIAYGHVMEYIPAPTSALLLEQISHTNGLPLSEARWTSMIESMVKGLHEIHECGVSHRDLALRNIIMSDWDRLSGAVFIDFAFATQADNNCIKQDAESIISAVKRFDIPEYEIKAWYDKQCAEKWVSMFSDVDFHDERTAKPIGQYPNLVRIWENPISVEWEKPSGEWAVDGGWEVKGKKSNWENIFKFSE